MLRSKRGHCARCIQAQAMRRAESPRTDGLSLAPVWRGCTVGHGLSSGHGARAGAAFGDPQQPPHTVHGSRSRIGDGRWLVAGDSRRAKAPMVAYLACGVLANIAAAPPGTSRSLFAARAPLPGQPFATSNKQQATANVEKRCLSHARSAASAAPPAGRDQRRRRISWPSGASVSRYNQPSGPWRTSRMRWRAPASSLC